MQHRAFLHHVEIWLETFGWKRHDDEYWIDPRDPINVETMANAVANQVRRSSRIEAECEEKL